MIERRKRFLFLIIFLLVNSFGFSKNIESDKNEKNLVLKNEKKDERDFEKIEAEKEKDILGIR